MNPGMTADQLVARVRATVKPFPQLNGLLISPGGGRPAQRPSRPPAPAPRPRPRPRPRPPDTPPALTPSSTRSRPWRAGCWHRRGGLRCFGGTPSGYVAGLYQAIDGRAPTADELSYNAAALQIRRDPRRPRRQAPELDRGAADPGRPLVRRRAGRDRAGLRLEVRPGGGRLRQHARRRVERGGGPGADVRQRRGGRRAAVATPRGSSPSFTKASWAAPPTPAGWPCSPPNCSAGVPGAPGRSGRSSPRPKATSTVAYLYRDDLGSSAGLPALEADAGRRPPSGGARRRSKSGPSACGVVWAPAVLVGWVVDPPSGFRRPGTAQVNDPPY